uniref:Opioid growth factor receptor (OGFr) conserved domain-containing protein n=1 Tax=Leptobrachium leishanense TaxID=445787 RepID=A0A8C5QFS3_9ANUR
MLIAEADKLTLGQVLHVKVPHAVKALLDVKGSYWFSNSRMTKYQAMMCENPRVHLDLIQEPQPLMPNYEFYMNWRKFEPKGEFIEIILHKWQDDYELLELNHDYIQWLFPTQTQGRNFYSTPLNPQETRLMIDTSEVQQRLRRAYKMMLKFFGVKVMGEEEGDTEITEVERAENFASRFENLTINPHNNLRITRILHSLGELGAEEYQAPLVRFFLKEILIKNRLDSQDRQDLLFFAWRYYFPKEEFVWGSHEELAQYKAKPYQVVLLDVLHMLGQGGNLANEACQCTHHPSNLGLAGLGGDLGEGRWGSALGEDQWGSALGKDRWGSALGKDRWGSAHGKDRWGSAHGKDRWGSAHGKDRWGSAHGKDRWGSAHGKDRWGSALGKDRWGSAHGKDRWGSALGKDRWGSALGKDRWGSALGKDRWGSALGKDRWGSALGEARFCGGDLLGTARLCGGDLLGTA